MMRTLDDDGVTRIAFAGDPPKLAKIIPIFPPGSDLFGEEINTAEKGRRQRLLDGWLNGGLTSDRVVEIGEIDGYGPHTAGG